jgi:hypothetical protein
MGYIPAPGGLFPLSFPMPPEATAKEFDFHISAFGEGIIRSELMCFHQS